MTQREQDRPDRPTRIAHISLHTSPQDQPGTGDSGGMNVYIESVARRLASQGVMVDVYTRCRGRGVPDVQEVAPGSRVIQVPAGPCAPVAKEDLPALLPEFLGGVLKHAAQDAGPHRHSPYDVVHSHYWLSGWVGDRAKEIWGVPHVASFHTLAKVKDASRDAATLGEPRVRVKGEEGVVRRADRLVAPTTTEADDLVELYGAERERIRVVPPGVDRQVFAPRPKEDARARVGLADGPVVLFVGRLQPLKGPDVAIRAFAHAAATAPETMSRATLAIVGGPSGSSESGAVERLRQLAARLRVGDRVVFVAPQPHARLADFYSAADVVVMPSTSESFGLVALEAQACGTPVVAAATGGLPSVIVDGVTGFVVEGRDPAAYADRLVRVIRDGALGALVAAAARSHAGRFSWDATVSNLRDLYREVSER